MDIESYQKNENFERNEAIYVLYTIDKKPLEEIATNFLLAIKELQQIIDHHTQYEEAMMGTKK